MTPPQTLEKFIVALLLMCYWAEGRKNEPMTGVINCTIGDGNEAYHYS